MNSSDNARAICGALQPLVGAAATGKLLVRSTGATGVVPAGSFAIPIVGGSLCEDGTVYTKRSAAADHDWAVSSGGTLVDVESLHGGSIANQPAGTEYLWAPALAGIETTSESGPANPLAGGTLADLLRQVVVYKNDAAADTDAFIRAQLAHFPGAILAWAGLAPLNGTQGANPGPRADRAGRGRMLARVNWVLYLVTSRLDSEAARRRTSDALRDAVVGELFGRQTVRELHVSNEPGLEILEARPFAVTPAFYVDVVRLSTAFTLTRTAGPAVYSDWMHTRFQSIEPAAAPLGPLTRLDATVDMHE